VSRSLLDESRVRDELETLTVTLAGRMLFEAGEYTGEVLPAVPDDATTIDCTPDALFLLATRKVADSGQFERLLGGKRLWAVDGSDNRRTHGAELAPIEKFVLGLLKAPMSLDDLRKAMPDYPKEAVRALACLVAGGIVLDFKGGSAAASLLPPANPKLRALLARLDPKAGSGMGDDLVRPLSEEEITQAEADKASAHKLLRESGDERAAYKLLASAVQTAPDAESLAALASVEMANPLWRQRALDRLKQAVEMQPKCTSAWLALGNYWGTRGQLDKQRRCLERILAFEPTNDAVREALESLSLRSAEHS
jgi:tetratricopeptide (TPR) repeat protein